MSRANNSTGIRGISFSKRRDFVFYDDFEGRRDRAWLGRRRSPERAVVLAINLGLIGPQQRAVTLQKFRALQEQTNGTN